jgi:acyl CoA:acetate/3-ketoacid CoA transferase alpha subunit
MEDYKIKFFVPGGAGTIEEKFKAASEYNARRYVMSRFPQARVVAVSVERVPKDTTGRR